MGRIVATAAAAEIRAAIESAGQATMIVATGASQFEVLAELVAQPDLDWTRVTAFHLDEYVGLADDHPASFCRYLRERFASKVPLKAFHYLSGEADPHETAAEIGELIGGVSVDVALVGIGENSHLAFNDPPADFETETPYLVLPLDKKCRQQQVGEGWFETINDVPKTAISMSVKQILKTKSIYCSVPDSQKADAVQATLEGAITPTVPASILRTHNKTVLIIDDASAAKLSPATLTAAERSE